MPRRGLSSIQEVNDGHFQKWHRYAQRHYSPTTVKVRTFDVKRFLRRLEEKALLLTDVRRRDVREYCDWLYDSQKEKNTGSTEANIDANINKNLQALRNLFEYLEEQEIMEDVPITRKMFRDHPQNNQPEHRTKIPIEQVETLYHGLRGLPMKQAIVGLLAETGMRPRECRMLDVGDIDFEAREINVRFGKGRKGQKQRIVIMSFVLHAVLKKWVGIRRTMPQASEALFVTKNSSRLTDKHFSRLLTRGSDITPSECERLDLPPITLGRFRPTWISWAKDQGMDDKVRYIQVGHTHQDVHISVYTQRNNEERLREHDRIGSLLA